MIFAKIGPTVNWKKHTEKKHVKIDWLFNFWLHCLCLSVSLSMLTFLFLENNKKHSIYPAILTAFKIRIRALSNSLFTTHALAATRSTSMAILFTQKQIKNKNKNNSMNNKK